MKLKLQCNTEPALWHMHTVGCCAFYTVPKLCHSCEHPSLHQISRLLVSATLNILNIVTNAFFHSSCGSALILFKAVFRFCVLKIITGVIVFLIGADSSPRSMNSLVGCDC